VRKKIMGTPERPRLCVFRSSRNIEGQIIDDVHGVTIVGLSTLAPELRARKVEGLTKTELARLAGRMLAERARERGVTRVVFDRGGYLYHGRVQAFAEGAREGGLEF
jgi:large subunit ribosomal protein L18